MTEQYQWEKQIAKIDMLTAENLAFSAQLAELRERADKTTQSEIREQARLINERDLARAQLALRDADLHAKNHQLQGYSARIEEIADVKAALVEARGEVYPQPKNGWQCFHCGEWFTTLKSAKCHFGNSPDDLRAQIQAAEDKITTLETENAMLKATMKDGIALVNKLIAADDQNAKDEFVKRMGWNFV